jgi:TatD DNase family protein
VTPHAARQDPRSGDLQVATGAASARRSFVDTHAHLQGEEFTADIDRVLARAWEAGVERIVVPGVDVESSRAAIALAEAHEGVFAAAGFHPHEASRLDAAALGEIESMLTQPKVVSVGEIGLDYYYSHSPRDAQLRCLDEMLRLAEGHRMPIIVHCREAWADMKLALDAWSHRVRAAFGEQPVGVMHYFSGTLEHAREYIELGFVISVHTSVTHKKQAGLREVVAQLPLESLVIETDAPYGAPQAYRGKRNEPAYVVEAAGQIASELGLPVEAVAAATSANAGRLFGLPVVAA